MFESYELKDDNYIVFVWKYTETCNMSCSYCDIDNSGKIKKDNKNKLLTKKLKAEAISNPNIEFLIDIEGGEPTLDTTVFNLPNELNLSNIKMKLFTNFHKPDIKKLAEFSKYAKIELSCNINENELSSYKANLRNLYELSNQSLNIEINILITDKSDTTMIKDLLKFLSNNMFNYSLCVAENFKNTKGNSSKDEILNIRNEYGTKASRLKFNLSGYSCNSKLIHINCNSLMYTKCDKNNQRSFLAFNSVKTLKEMSICRNLVCGIHDYQLNFKKVKQ